MTDDLLHALLLTTGREPNIDSSDFRDFDVEFDTKIGLEVNNRLQTTSLRVYDMGNCCSAFMSAHAAEVIARYPQIAISVAQ